MRTVTVKWYERTFEPVDPDEEYTDEGETRNEGDVSFDEDEDEDSLTLQIGRYLRNAGANEPSSSPSWHKGTWYTARDTDFRTGESTETSYHIGEGLTDEEAAEIYDAVTE